MLDRKSIYAINKKDSEAIVYVTANGQVIRLTYADFESKEEFERWKAWSDDDYHTTEKAGRSYTDNCVRLIETEDNSSPSAENVLLDPLFEAERIERRAALLETVISKLTEKQYRRLRMYYLEGMTETEIAKLEGVGQQRISRSLAAGRKVIRKIFARQGVKLQF